MFKYKLKKYSKNKNIDLAYLSRRTPFWKPLLFLAPAFALILLFMVYPAYLSFNYAFFVEETDAIKAGTGEWGIGNFDYILNHSFFWKAFWNSILYALLQLPISITISLVLSSVISSLLRKWLRGGWQTVFFLPYVTSGIAVAMAFSYMFSSTTDNIGLINDWFNLDIKWLNSSDPHSWNPLFVMVVNGVWRALAFQVLIFTTAMMGVDKDRYRSASIDGAGTMKQFFSITLPSINKTFNFIVTVGLIGSIKVFPLALFNNTPSTAMLNGGATLMLYVYNFMRGSTPNLHYAAASSMILVVVSIVFSVTIKNGIRLTGLGLEKWGEIRVQNKIANKRA